MRLLITFLITLFCVTTLQAQAKLYRGSLGDNHIEMRLNLEGNSITGSYSYDQFGQDLKLAGNVTAKGDWEFAEFAPGGKKTGKFVCHPAKSRFDTDLECEWTKPTGNAQSSAYLSEQHPSPQDIKITPKVINRNRTNTTVSYPQLSGPGVNVNTAAAFNRLIAKLVNDAIKEFQPEPPPARTAFDTNYSITFVSSDVVSVEMNEYTDSGGAHPNSRVWGLTYDLKRNREVKLADLFKRGSDFLNVLKKYSVEEINRHADYLDAEETRLNGKPPANREEPLMTEEQLTEAGDFGLTPEGIAIYYDFPHVIAVFNKVVVPYDVVKNLIDPNGVAGRFAETGRPK